MNRGGKRLLVVLATLLICLSLLSILRTACGGRPERNYQASELVGRVMAEETAALIGNRGRVVLLAGDAGAQRAQGRAFKKTLREKPGIQLLAEKEFTPDEIGEAAIRGQIPWELFRDTLSAHPGADVFVSLVGPPQVRLGELASIRDSLPKLVVFAPMSIGVGHLLEQGLVQVAVVPRSTIAAPPRPVEASPVTRPGPLQTGTPPERALFDAQYQVLTPESDLSGYHEPVVPSLPGPK